MDAYLIIYQCIDDGEQEACFTLLEKTEAVDYVCSDNRPPEGFEDRPGFYFFENQKILHYK
jgi:hypothetical protein